MPEAHDLVSRLLKNGPRRLMVVGLMLATLLASSPTAAEGWLDVLRDDVRTSDPDPPPKEKKKRRDWGGSHDHDCDECDDDQPVR